jgi:hypothetical protein
MAGLLLAAAPAEASFKAAVSLSTSAGKVRLVVKLTSTKTLTTRTRPSSVKVKVGKKTYTLSKARASAAKTVAAGTWRSAAYSGKAGAALSALAGKAVSVKVGSRAGTSTLHSTVPKPKTGGGGGGVVGGGGGGGGGGATPLFEAPGRQLEGQETAPFLQRYFINSRFTDCPGAGWPACSVEERYNHCPDGSWEYHRLTPTSGSDINSYASIQVTGARVNADGSWIVEYTENGYGVTHFYHWEIATNGRVLGTYDNNTAQPLGPFQYQQPANCGSY